MSDLYRLVYASKNLLQGSEAEITSAVRQILDASRRNNADVSVTGALMFNTGAFAQVLEGPRRGVEATFERIQRDPRHSDVTVLQCGPTECRGFANWSMAFVGQSSRGQARFSGLAAESGFDPARLDGDSVFAMLHGLVLEEEGLLSAEAASPVAEAREAVGLDVEQVRAEIARLRPDAAAAPAARAQPARTLDSREPGPESRKDMSRSSNRATDAALCVLKAALASERQRTTELRAEIDALQVALASGADRLDAMRAERDLWAGRARLLARAMAQEADGLHQAAQGAAPLRDGARPSGGSDSLAA
ncbi:BLUF domain-containing protein [Methylobacterium sp. NEAU K]|uniref:BLUF domain-containing protein n=1 Tax=Methylobacterium sp. NEAU K TaxID=3064946 RepID=UPI0027349312|nr:BLUF domain-containing protein [Methylobacterium sp. NEAU K]MDP4006727.1 BLUF domain-containing protein [Methylobacterium sp. NEAU K]